MNKARIIFGYIFSFIFTLLLSLLVLLLLFKFTVGNKNYVINILEKDSYYQKINEEIKEEMKLHILSSGFTDEIIKDVYTEEDVINDIKLFINNTYDGKLTIIDTSEILNKVNNNIDNFFKENNLLVSNKAELNEFTEGLVKIYSDEINLYGFTDSMISKIPKIIKIIDLGMIVSSMSLFVLIIFLLIIKYYYFSSSIIASGMIILFLRLFVFEKVDVNDLLIITEEFSVELRNILMSLQNLSFILGIVLIIIGVILIIVKSVSIIKNNS